MAEFFSIIWQLYSLPLPFLGENITVGGICVGFFIVSISILIIRSIIGGADK